jgi:hypothetical protein
MFPGLTVPEHRQTATKRIAAYCACVSVLFLAAVLFGFHRGLQAPKKIPADRRISAVPAGIQPRLAVSYGKLPLGFEANQGQVRGPVKFLSRGRGYTIFLTHGEAVLALRKSSVVSGQLSVGTGQKPSVAPTFRSAPSHVAQHPLFGAAALPDSLPLPGPEKTSDNEVEKPRDRRAGPALPFSSRRLADTGESSTVLRMRLVGANAKATVTGGDELPGKANYFIGNDPKKWRTNVPRYARVRYEGVYRGIDLVYYGNQRQLEYDFVVAPGADPRAIKLDVVADGVRPAKGERRSPPKIGASGDLVVRTDGGEVRLLKPVVYQPPIDNGQRTTDYGQRTPVDAHYALHAGNQVGFKVGSYDRSRPLIIDPVVLSYSTYLGGSGTDQGNAIAVDSSGSAFVAGITNSTDFPTVNPILGTNNTTNQNYIAFVAKLNAAGSALVYSTYLGGSLGSSVGGIAVDGSGNAYVTGNTMSTDFPTVNPLQPTNHGGAPGVGFEGGDAFVAEINATGSALVYSTYLGGSGTDQGNAIAVDSSGNAYVSGFTGSTDFPTVNPLQATNHASLGTSFVAKLNAAGSALVYSTYLGGSESDTGRGIAVDSSGNAYVTGDTQSTGFPTVNPLQATNKASHNTSFVAKLNAVGSALVYSTYLGGSIEDDAYGIAVDGSGNAYVIGATQSSNFPTVAPLQGTIHGPTNAFVAKLNAAGSALAYSTYLGGSMNDGGYGIAVDNSGNAYLTGFAYSTDFPTVIPLQATNNASGGTSFVAKLNAAGSALVYSTYLGGSGGDAGSGIAVDSSGNAYVTGGTSSTDFPTADPLQATNHGGASDAFVAKLTYVPKPAITLTSSTLTFTNQIVGTSSAAQTVTLTNSGDASLNISAVALTGTNAGDFTNSADTCSGATLLPTQTCIVSVTFAPTASGIRTGVLTITDNASNSPQTVSLTGTGILGPLVTLSPTSISFPNQFVGTSGLPINVTLTNSGDQPLTISSVQAGGDFGATSGCTSSLPAGVNCTIGVFFDPSASGLRTGTLTITDNASSGPQTVQLSGTGMDFTMSSPATSATVTAGQQATYALTVTPQGGLNQTVNLTCSGAPSLSTCTLAPSSVTLNGTASAPVAVTVSTTAGSLAPPFGEVSPPSITGLGRMFWLYALLMLASLTPLARAGKRRAAYLLGACLLIVMFWSACGGGGAPQMVHTPGTPSGTYTLDVTATVISTATPSTLTHDLKLTLTVD